VHRDEGACIRDPSFVDEADDDPSGRLEISSRSETVLSEPFDGGLSDLMGSGSPPRSGPSRFTLMSKRVQNFVEERTVVQAWKRLKKFVQEEPRPRVKKLGEFSGKKRVQESGDTPEFGEEGGTRVGRYRPLPWQPPPWQRPKEPRG